MPTKRLKQASVLELIREMKNEGITTSEIAEYFEVSQVAAQHHVIRLKQDGVIFGKKDPGKWSSVRWFAIEYKKEEEPVEDDCKKNAEGYSDPTAARALNMKGKYTEVLHPGGVYLFNGTREVLIVDDRSPDTVIGFDVEAIDADRLDTDTIVNCKIGNFTDSVHVNWLKSYDPRKFDHSLLWAWPLDSYKKIISLSPLHAKVIEVKTEVCNDSPETLNLLEKLEAQNESLLNENGDLRYSNKKMGDTISELWEIAKVDNCLPDDAPIDPHELVDHVRWLKETAANWHGMYVESIQNRKPLVEYEVVKAQCDIYKNFCDELIKVMQIR